MYFFISRSLQDNSPFQKLRKEGHTINDNSLIDITYVGFDPDITSPWIFFYSTHGVKAFFEISKYSSDKKYAVMGAGTAASFLEFTEHKADFIGNGTAQFAADFLLNAELNSNSIRNDICFVKANNSLNQVEKLVQQKLKCVSKVVYVNEKKKGFQFPNFDVLIFTSPLNVEAYFDRNGFHGEQLFAIGETTAQKIYNTIGAVPFYCTSPSEINLYKLVCDTLLNH